ncbi:hypothetical protein E2P81_ATG01130 [Venturia nashicola]|uniref:Uncharacterized protein n=1 Tax=Venturia nashicola TaxID=86259 RepID=A0A4Z1PRA4_9PEZI|nr:hypothetical protein E6O75_ATG01158 [Venturia nashicola]TLD38587.1 hypothetical protein E2P81_ATG01130 [Venturia nashicola]
MASIPTKLPTLSPRHPADSNNHRRGGAFFLAISFSGLLLGIAFLVWYLRRRYYRQMSYIQQTSLPMNPLTRPPPPYDLKANVRMHTVLEEGPRTSSGITGTTKLTPKTSQAMESAGFPRLFEVEKERMRKIMGKKRMTDLEVATCKGKTLETINNRKNQEAIDRRSMMSQKTQNEIKEKEALKADAVNMAGTNPFNDNYEVKDDGAEGYVAKKIG